VPRSGAEQRAPRATIPPSPPLYLPRHAPPSPSRIPTRIARAGRDENPKGLKRRPQAGVGLRAAQRCGAESAATGKRRPQAEVGLRAAQRCGAESAAIAKRRPQAEVGLRAAQRCGARSEATGHPSLSATYFPSNLPPEALSSSAGFKGQDAHGLQTGKGLPTACLEHHDRIKNPIR
jgi:hypothetical protein